jgi:hypothetical protein
VQKRGDVEEAADAARHARIVAAVSWIAALTASAVLLALTHYSSRDPDSTVYAGIAARLAEEPVRRWIAPDWWGLWGARGLFREHPIGIFLLPAVVARLGYPAGQAAYFVNGCFQAASLILISALATACVPRRESRALAWMLQLLLIAFVFRVRANQEFAVLAGIALALYATERSRERVAWAWVTAAAFVWVLLVKGVFGLVVPALCSVWLAVRGRGAQRAAVPWVALALTMLAAPFLAAGYEAQYRSVSGESFLAFYFGPRLDVESVAAGALTRWPGQVFWYTGRLLWYALPWSVFAVAAFVTVAREWSGTPKASRGVRAQSESRGLLFVAASAALLIAAFALADRRADRFIFPAYFLVGAAGAIAAIRWSPRLSRAVDVLDRPWVPPAFWLGLFLLRLASGPHLPRLMLR